MYSNHKILSIIPARGGSKGIKGKNIIDLCGKPLIAYSINSALGSVYVDDIVVTTDSIQIAEIARKYGAEVPFMRPKQLAEDNSKTIDAVIHAIEELKKRGRAYDCVVLLQATQPLRTSDDIDSAIEEYYKRGEKGLVSVSVVEDNPILIRTLNENQELSPMLPVSSTCRRQDMPTYYKVNGCIYINKVSDLNINTSFNDNRVPYIMPAERSVDIDEMKDIQLAKYYISLNEDEVDV